MIEGPYKDQTVVWGQLCEVTVYRKHKTVWEAVSEHLGQSIRVKRSTRRAAVKAWGKLAEYRTN